MKNERRSKSRQRKRLAEKEEKMMMNAEEIIQQVTITADEAKPNQPSFDKKLIPRLNLSVLSADNERHSKSKTIIKLSPPKKLLQEGEA